MFSSEIVRLIGSATYFLTKKTKKLGKVTNFTFFHNFCNKIKNIFKNSKYEKIA
ncbi:hypothetical protein HMPREF9430_00758 [Solobacterium moorei F0204]|uniref:Uncharacterized protein n=1 Tax=Solobacterium moorei F0204 TaxID=706433 RepID=E7MMJ1_9FIRM|nr:hypothetical protein HMPREF9430_00758 [Solobacterium moorei F0204]